MKTPDTTQHGGSGEPSPTAHVPEPPFAERARTLVHLGRTGTLSTQSRKVPGHPFGSVAPYGVGVRGAPTFLISRMAMHTQNLEADERAALLVTQPGWTEDPLAGARVTMVGEVAPVPEAEAGVVRDDYLGRHPNARYWVDFGDFGFWRMRLAELYYVAGFGAMGWVAAEEYAGSEPDPLAESAAGILDHMNADHAEALLVYSRAFAGVEADEATMTGVDRMGFRLRARSGERLQGLRVNFPRPARSSDEVRAILIEMLREGRARP